MSGDPRLGQLRNRGCVCESFTITERTKVENGHLDSCPRVNRRCSFCHALVGQSRCSVLFCATHNRWLGDH